ncbi:VanW family protein [Clostridium aciditolerans]|uniref:VanW family protein n=1 Tax=Clostridium aciditolerans TaxID=339861 RepID=UPI0031B5A818
MSIILVLILAIVFIFNFTNEKNNNQVQIDNASKARSIESHKLENDKKSTVKEETDKKDFSDKNAVNKNTKDTNRNEAIAKEQDSINISSSTVTSVPWENDENFKKAQEKYGTHIMMCAYCAVLNDPLPGEEENVHVGAKLLCGTLVEPSKVFSQNRTIGPYIQSRGYKKGPTYEGSHLTETIGGGVCKIASTLYNVAIMGNLPIVERHAHCMPVSYVPYGQDATVCYGSLDFRFKNNTDSSILIWSQGIDNRLYIGFYGKSKPPKVEWHHQVLSSKKTSKVYKTNKSLSSNEEKLVVTGMDGAIIKSWITIENPDGTIQTKQLGESRYLPLPYIYERRS